MAEGIKLIVGLGNPTKQYEKTRHNAGFWFLDELAERQALQFKSEVRFHGAAASCSGRSGLVYLLKPMQYMNRSGMAVASLAHYYKIPPEQILVAHDELDFAAGTVKLKFGGGHGGHNGLRDIVEKLGSANFYRLRIGIGRPANQQQVADYVLDVPPKHDALSMHEAIVRAIDSLPDMLNGRLDHAMNVLNTAKV